MILEVGGAPDTPPIFPLMWTVNNFFFYFLNKSEVNHVYSNCCSSFEI